MSAYHLQLQLASAAATTQTVARQLAAMHAYAAAMGAAGAPALARVQRAESAFKPLQAALNRSFASVSRAERGMDSYEGLPTAAQSQALSQAWTDAASAVRGVNAFLAHDMSAVYAAIPSGRAWPKVTALAIPQRP